MPLTAISLVSAGVIGLEVLLMRLYSIVAWHHFASMIISIALLGYGVSGSFIAIARKPLLARFDTAWRVNAVLFGLGAVAGFAAAERLAVNPLTLPWDPGQMLTVALVYLLLMLPFFCAANCVGLAFAREGGAIGRIYRYDLVGAGAGAALVIGALFLLPPADYLKLPLVLGFAAAAVFDLGQRRITGGLGLAAAGIVLVLALPAAWTAPKLSEFKDLSQLLRVPGTQVVAEHAGPLGLVSVVESPELPLRHAPGLSLLSPAGPPEQLGLFVDGDGAGVIARFDGELAGLAYLDYTTAALPYHLLTRPRVLLLGAGGGAGTLRARYHGVRRIDAVLLDPAVADLVAERFADFAGGIYGPAGARLHIAEARAFAATTREAYDLIQLPAVGSGAAAAGLGGLTETYAYTVEAFRDYLARLAPGGLIAVTGPVELPPRQALRLAATAARALEARGVARPGRRLALIRGFATTTLLVKHGDFTAAELAQLRRFAEDRSFDLAYYPGMARGEANRFNLLDRPQYFDGVTALLGPDRDGFLARYKFDLRPATDDRPYFLDFLKWRALPELLALRKQGTMALVQWGRLLLGATLLQAAALSAVLILLPLALRRRPVGGPGRGRTFGYFFAIGLAFLFVEIAFIQRLVLFLGHPLYSVAVALAAFLIFAGLGAGTAKPLARRCADRRLAPVALAVAGIVAIALVYLAVLPPLLHWLMPLAPPFKVAAALVLIAPLAFLMGMPFPLALADLADTAPARVPWAFGINGCASVVSAVLATLLAIELGFSAVVAAAALLYTLAATLWRRPAR